MRWTEEQYQKWLEGTEKPVQHETKTNKYGAKKTEYSGRKYDSQKEAERAAELHTLEHVGQIKDLREQVDIELIPPFKYEGVQHKGIYYRADFVYVEDGQQVIEDVKGYKTDTYKIKKKILLQRYGQFIKFIET